MRCLLVLSVAGLAACASANTATERTPTEQTVRVVGAGGITAASASMVSSDEAASTTLPITVEQGWRLLPTVYEAVGIPITIADPAKHSVGNDGFNLRRQLGKTSLSRYLDCGETQIGPNADTYQVHLSVHTQITPDASGNARISTLVEAAAKPVTFNQDYSHCTSTGRLEQRIADEIRTRTAK